MFKKKSLVAPIAASMLTMATINQTANAEAGISVTTDASSPANVTANVNFKIIVPKVMILSVGDWGSKENTVTWNYNFGQSTLTALSNDDATKAQWDAATATTPTGSTADTDDFGTTTDGKVAVKVFGNVGDIKLTSALVGSDFSTTDTTVSAGYTKPKIAEISATNGSNISHGAFGATGNITPVTFKSATGVVVEEDEWTYSYTPTASPAGGTYTAEVQYTLADV